MRLTQRCHQQRQHRGMNTSACKLLKTSLEDLDLSDEGLQLPQSSQNQYIIVEMVKLTPMNC